MINTSPPHRPISENKEIPGGNGAGLLDYHLGLLDMYCILRLFLGNLGMCVEICTYIQSRVFLSRQISSNYLCQISVKVYTPDFSQWCDVTILTLIFYKKPIGGVSSRSFLKLLSFKSNIFLGAS